jgi:hypothetical protein
MGGMTRRRRIAVVGAVALIVGGLAFYDFGYTIVWDGSYPLTVSLRPAEPDRIARVWAGATSRRDFAYELIDSPVWADNNLLVIPDWQKPFVVSVNCSGAESGFGRELWRAQYRALVLRIEYVDGRRVDQIVDVPDSKQIRDLTVQLP